MGFLHALHVFLRHRACHGSNKKYTFEAFSLAEAAFDIAGIELPVSENARSTYFEPAATGGKTPAAFFRHADGPRQTFLNRFYTGLVGAGPRQPKLFDASSNVLPVTISLQENWIDVLRSYPANTIILTKGFRTSLRGYSDLVFPALRREPLVLPSIQEMDYSKLRPAVSLTPLPDKLKPFETTLAEYFGLPDRALRSSCQN